MIVSDVMVKKVITLEPKDTLRDIAMKFSKHDISGAPVVDSKNHVIGIVSETDIIATLKKHQKEMKMVYISPSLGMVGLSFREKPVDKKTEEVFRELGDISAEEMMMQDVITVAPDDELQSVVEIIATGKINRVPVVKNGKLIGIVTRGDIIKAMSTEVK